MSDPPLYANQPKAPLAATPGAWKSPITLDLVFANTVGLSGISILGSDVYWLESRVTEGGRSVLVKHSGAAEPVEISSKTLSVRSRVHEYGGGAYVVGDDAAYCSNDEDLALYVQSLEAPASPAAFFTGQAGLRYGDFVLDARRRRVIAVREDHRIKGREAVNSLVAIELDNPHREHVIQAGWDFYSSPRLSPDGQHLAWLSWNHPNMPWDGTTLWLADVEADGALRRATIIAGGVDESIFQPEFSPHGDLAFVSDRSGWWNLYLYRGADIRALHPLDAEFGAPQWVFGMSLYGFCPDGNIVCVVQRQTGSQLAWLNPESGELISMPVPQRDIRELRVGRDFAVYIGGSPSQANAVVKIDLSSGKHQVLRQSSSLRIDEGYLSVPQAIEFPTAEGQSAHAFFYPAVNCDYTAPPGVKCPLLVLDHGGPTSSTTPTLNASIQYWTSRGFGVVDVNYGGSSGFGRAYRQRLNGKWGVVDVEDSVRAAQYLVDCGFADPAKLAIRGGSAGGYTTLCALTFHTTFGAGASYYGIGDLETLARDTHKFESRYLDSLVGPYPASRDLYRARSPIHHTQCLSTPIILFQGLKDLVVPPNQAQMMFDAVRTKGLPVAFVSFPDERHGFRAVESNKRALSAELYFYGKVFGFEPADAIDPVHIENLGP